MEWPVLLVAAAIALMAVAIAFWADRARARERRRLLAEPPERPGLATPARPAYLTADQVRSQSEPAGAAGPGPDQAEVARRIEGVPAVDGGWASPDFVTDPAASWAVLDSPVVVVVEAVDRTEDLVGLIRRVQAMAAPLVVVARRIGPEPLTTLGLNAVAGRLACLCLVTDQPEAVARRLQVPLLTRSEVVADYFPDQALGRCELWVSDKERSWIV